MEYILITAIALIVLAGIIIFLYLQNNIIDITQYNIQSDDCGSLKIVQLSDLHAKTKKRCSTLAKNLSKLQRSTTSQATTKDGLKILKA